MNKQEARMIHSIKIKKCYMLHILDGQKTFEVRFNDRDYQVGDVLYFHPLEDDDYDVYCGRDKGIPMFNITYVHHGMGMETGYVVLGIEPQTDG